MTIAGRYVITKIEVNVALGDRLFVEKWDDRAQVVKISMPFGKSAKEARLQPGLQLLTCAHEIGDGCDDMGYWLVAKRQKSFLK